MKKLIIFLGMMILLIAGSVSQHQFLLTQYAHLFTVNNATKGADALVVLSGGMMTRLPYAIELYQQQYAPVILFTEEKKRIVSPKLESLVSSNMEVARKIMTALKANVKFRVVPSAKGGATSTFDEAYDLLQYGRQHHFKRVIIVSDAFHTRRALYAFKKIFENSDIQIEAMGAPNAIFDETNWWQADVGISTYVLEGIKYMVYRFTNQNVSFVKNY
ncbi:MAG: YdcF family protein [SAR324 cluster bacterium]|nr:YdcF family protein [SAR324 cluster bacterium]